MGNSSFERPIFPPSLCAEVLFKGAKCGYKEVERLEGEIDELVYKLYGLDAKDREVIEDFLRRLQAYRFGGKLTLGKIGKEKRIKRLLEKEAGQLNLKLEVMFVDKNIIPRAPVRPEIYHKFKGVIKIPRSWLEILTDDEFRGVWLHEVAHIKSRHFCISLGLVLILFFPFSIWGYFTNYLILFLAIGMLFSLLIFLRFHRRLELAADKYAADKTSSQSMIHMLEKFDKWSKSVNIEHCRITRALLSFSHPTVPERIERLKRLENE